VVATTKIALLSKKAKGHFSLFFGAKKNNSYFCGRKNKSSRKI
jgi:hypothetical protein